MSASKSAPHSKDHSAGRFSATAQDWLEGARPHTWANAFAPVVAGTGAAFGIGGGHVGRALLALIVAWALIIGVNYANDYSDGIRGTDDDRTGPQRLTGGGLARPQHVKLAAFAAFAVAAVFVFFGLVAVLGTEFTQAGRLSWSGLALAVGIGTMSSGVNLVNNIRDIPSDAETGKITLAVRLGNDKARLLFTVLLLLPFLLTIGIAFSSWLALAGLVYFPFALRAIRTVNRGAQGPELIPVLGLTGRAMLMWAVIEAAALIIV